MAQRQRVARLEYQAISPQKQTQRVTRLEYRALSPAAQRQRVARLEYQTASIAITTADDQIGVEPFATVRLVATVTSGAAASVVWTHSAGPLSTAALSSTSSLTPTYVAPGTLDGAVDTWVVTVTDSAGNTATGDIIVSVFPATEFTYVSGFLRAVQINAA